MNTKSHAYVFFVFTIKMERFFVFFFQVSLSLLLFGPCFLSFCTICSAQFSVISTYPLTRNPRKITQKHYPIYTPYPSSYNSHTQQILISFISKFIMHSIEQILKHSSVRSHDFFKNLSFISNMHFILVGSFTTFVFNTTFNPIFQDYFHCTLILMGVFHFLFVSHLMVAILEGLTLPATSAQISVFMGTFFLISVSMMSILSMNLLLVVLLIWGVGFFLFYRLYARHVTLSNEQTQNPEHHSVRKQKFSKNLISICFQNAVALGSFVPLKIQHTEFFDDNINILCFMFVMFKLHYVSTIIFEVQKRQVSNGMLEISVTMKKCFECWSWCRGPWCRGPWCTRCCSSCCCCRGRTTENQTISSPLDDISSGHSSMGPPNLKLNYRHQSNSNLSDTTP
ncbi:uncharacterized protein LOC127115532 isoform X2 [Lathyrus oleraceus]|uniref:uncharacterized protein LOC127115532 isoform X2 n=1 Tax=Pisum sativum TaxID=3888 RepID=UPI0021D279EA|nr:uncharacterized protein LOC127115532 isoform X2 [Pisum sativum]